MANDDITIYAPAHGLSSGDYVTITGVQGLTDANGAWKVWDADDDSFKIVLEGIVIAEQSDQTYTSAGLLDGKLASLTGLGHLSGFEVIALGDGTVIPRTTIRGTSTTLDQGYDKVVIGHPFTYQLESMRYDTTTNEGTSRGTKKRIYQASVSFFETANAQYGDSEDTYSFDWHTDEAYDSPLDLFTGAVRTEFNGGFSEEDEFIISGSDPLPCTVRGIVYMTQ